MKFLIIIVLLVALSNLLYSHDQHILSGQIIELDSRKPISNALIKIPKLDIEFSSDENGKFVSPQLKDGRFEIIFEAKGYQRELRFFTLEDDEIPFFKIELIRLASDLPTLIVESKKTQAEIEELSGHTHLLKGKELMKELGESLANTLKNELGISIRSMGPAPARPVIRGLGGDRVSIRIDGIALNDMSAGSPDHAVAADPASAEQIEIIRGPRSLLFSGSAIGGIIDIKKNDIPQKVLDNSYLDGSVFYETANNGVRSTLVYEQPINSYVSLKGDAMYKKAGEISSPSGKLKNTTFETFNTSFGFGSEIGESFVGSSLNLFKSEYGIPGGFVGSHPKGVRIAMDKTALNIDAKYHLHDEFVDDISILANSTYYNHKEYEGNRAIGAEFQVRSNNMLVKVIQHETDLFMNGTIGLFIEHKDYKYGGYVFSPWNETIEIAPMIYEEIEIDEGQLQIAVRVAYNSINPYQLVTGGKLANINKKEFVPFSFSISYIKEVSEKIYGGATFSRFSRAPSSEELFSEGPHLAAYSYDIGNPNLRAEVGYSNEIFIRATGDVSIGTTLFLNEMPYYIFPYNTGRINVSTLLPIFETTGKPVRMYGVELDSKIQISDDIKFTTGISYTEGIILGESKYLPMMPPIKLNSQIRYDDYNSSYGIKIDGAMQQNNLGSYEELTAGYVVFGIFGQYLVTVDKITMNISLNIDNIFNQEYRNHLSRIKSIMPEVGRNFRMNIRFYY